MHDKCRVEKPAEMVRHIFSADIPGDMTFEFGFVYTQAIQILWNLPAGMLACQKNRRAAIGASYTDCFRVIRSQ